MPDVNTFEGGGSDEELTPEERAELLAEGSDPEGGAGPGGATPPAGGNTGNGEPSLAEVMAAVQGLAGQVAEIRAGANTSTDHPEIRRARVMGNAMSQAMVKAATDKVAAEDRQIARQAQELADQFHGIVRNDDGEVQIGIDPATAPTRPHLDLPVATNQRRPTRDLEGTATEETDAEKAIRLEREKKALEERGWWDRLKNKK